MTEEKKEGLLYRRIPESDNVSQGDILFNFPIFLPSIESIQDVEEISIEGLGKHMKMTAFTTDIIVLTQACDLVNNEKRNPIDSVVCAAITDIGLHSWEVVGGTNSNRNPSYYLLNKEDDVFPKSHLINFEELFTVPYDVLTAFKNNAGDRVRPTSPILEKISQHFGNYFSRIGTEYERQKAELKVEHKELKEKIASSQESQ